MITGASHTRRGVRATPRRARQEALWAFGFLAPAMLVILVVRIAPTAAAMWTSLQKGFPGGIREPDFVGLANYGELFANQAFLDTLWRTLVFNVIINPAQVALALLIAVLMTRRLHLTGVWRILMFIPATIPIVGSSIVWGVAMRQEGPINAFLALFGIGNQGFFTDPNQAMVSIMVVITWVGVGYWMIFLISGLENIPEEYYEAARLDRAGPMRTFFSVTLPLLKRPLLFVLVADTVANFVLFVPIQMLTGGGPQSSTTMQMFNAYRTTYAYSDRYLGATEVVILTLVMLGFVALQFWLLREEKDQ